jgi:hypothetical protein
LASMSTGTGLGMEEIAPMSVPAPEGELACDRGSGSETAELETGSGSAGVDLASTQTGSDAYMAEIAHVSAPALEGELSPDAGSGSGTVGLEDGLGLARADLASASTGSGVHVAETAPVSARGRFWADLASASTGRAEQARRTSSVERLRQRCEERPNNRGVQRALDRLEECRTRYRAPRGSNMAQSVRRGRGRGDRG